MEIDADKPNDHVADLVSAARQGDLESFNQLVLKYQNEIYNQVFWILRSRELAEDITQEAFLQAYQNLHQYRGGSFRAWLHRIAANASYDELRRRKRRPTIPLTRVNDYGEEIESNDWLTDQGQSVEETAERRDIRAALQRYLDELSPEYRSAVLLVDVMEMDYSEAAYVMGVPIGTLKSRLVRGRLRLRNRLTSAPEHLFLADLAEAL